MRNALPAYNMLVSAIVFSMAFHGSCERRGVLMGYPWTLRSEHRNQVYSVLHSVRVCQFENTLVHYESETLNKIYSQGSLCRCAARMVVVGNG